MRRALLVSLAIGAAIAAAIACGSSQDTGGATDAGPSVPAPADAGPTGPGAVLDGAVPDTGAPLPSCDPGAGDVSFTIDATKNEHRISPYIYGTNLEGAWSGLAKNLTLARAGGNRWTAYDWENNASNAGSDYLYESDGYLGGGATAGEAVRSRVAAAFAAGASIIVTVPTQGWVAADENGPVDAAATDLTTRFRATSFAKGAPYVYPPVTTDGTVYEDEFVHWLEGAFPGAHSDPARSIFYMLDNEPDLWASTHAEIEKAPITYAELLSKSIPAATAIKQIAPGAVVLGPASYGWNGYVSLQNAPDAKGRDFVEYYLDQWKSAEASAGKRLLDALDLHWYPEATGDGVRISNDDSATPSAGLVEARVQAPRSLWDPTYVETSWITQSLGGKAIDLIPLMQGKIAQHYPGTGLSFSEYDYGGGQHVSGAIAEADVLGIFGKLGVFAATHWPQASTVPYIYAGLAMYRSYDGAGGAFGDTSVDAETSDATKTSVYASVHSDAPGRMTLVAINKTGAPLRAAVRIAFGTALSAAAAWQVTSASASPAAVSAPPTPSCQAFVYTLPAMSVTTLALR
jgi:hypothetical protein